jgi:hypothetical protein
VLVAVSAALAAARHAGASLTADTTPPQLASLTITPSTIDTSTAAQNVTVQAHITDDLAGLSDGGSEPVSTITFTGPSGAQHATGYLTQAQRTAGSPLDGTYATIVTIPRASETGTWSATVSLVDTVGNTASLTSTQLAAAGDDSGFQQTGAGDTAAPTVLSLAISPPTIDTSQAPATITVTTRITDNLSGVSNGSPQPPSQLVLQGPTGSHHVQATFGLAQRVSGSNTDGIYSTTVTVPHYAEQGTWSVASYTVVDNVGNQRVYGAADLVGPAFTATFDQQGAGDINAPRFVQFAVVPTAVDASQSDATVTFLARITDNLAGVASGVTDSPSQVTFRSPSGSQSITASFGLAQLTSGTNLDGWYSYQGDIPKGAESGTWTLSSGRPVDAVHNAAVYDAASWAALGLPSSFDVTSSGTPGAPTSVVAIDPASDGAAQVSWVPPALTGSGAITSYTVTASPGGTTATANGTATSVVVSGLTDGVSYTFTVHATNGAGDGPESAPSNAFVPGNVVDTDPPQLSGLAIAPVSLQTTSGPATIGIDVGISDDVSGPADNGTLSSVAFDQPDGTTGPTATVAASQRTAGTAQLGTYHTSLTLPQGSQLGTWTVATVTLVDGAGHTTSIDATTLAADGFATGFVVVSATLPDPPLSVTATAGEQQAAISWQPPADDGGSPITSYVVSAQPSGGSVTVDGNATTTVFTGLSDGVVYTFTVAAVNAIGTGPDSASSNPVTPGAGDVDPPQLESLTLTPATAQTSSAPQMIAVTAHIVDAASGVAGTGTLSALTLDDPTGAVLGTATFGPATLTSGDANDGMYTDTIMLPAGAAAGSYPIASVVLVDAAGNQATLDATALAAAGFPDSLMVTAAVVPDAPSNVVAVAGDAQATVTWDAPVDDGGDALTSYTVTAQPGGATASVDGATTQAVVTGLANGTAYSFTVVATNGVGDSAPSTPSDPVTPLGPPAAPTNVVAIASDSSATVMWSAPASDGGSPITGYTITSAPDGVTVTVDATATSATVEGLTNGTAYTFTVVATNVLGDGPASDPSAAVVPATVPDAPANVVAVAADSSATVSWTPASDGGSPITGYVVTSTPDGVTVDVDGATTQVVVSGLTNGTAYTFTVVATNAIGAGAPSTPSDPVTPVTTPGMPTNVTAVAGNASAIVTWTAPADDGGAPITGYTIQAVDDTIVVTVDGATTSTTITGLTNGRAYLFTVVATNAAGVSPPSLPSSAVVPASVPGAPTNVVAVAGDTTATVSWSAPDADGGVPIAAYVVTNTVDGTATIVTGDQTSATIVNLTDGVAYTFTVTAVNVIGPGPPSDPTDPVTPG